MTSAKRLALIPARGGSQRIPRKNIRSFCGQPIIKYSIDAAHASGLFDVVMVSTDDEEIAGIARQFGAEVPFMRSAKNADHEATTVDVIKEVLTTYAAQDVHFESCCCIYPTAPLIHAESLRASFEQLERDGLDSVFPVVAFDYPIQRATRINASGCLELIDSSHRFSRSQDLAPAYHDAGQFYTFRTEVLLKTGDIWTEKTGAVVLSAMQIQDIDTEDDWALAELKFERINGP
ncbi:MAG: pseudaminic acid cytidylyltransferase [Myxococcales bacterium]|nr:pseudaminic acid cytidylyltransferase [Myxococcales bacterium]